MDTTTLSAESASIACHQVIRASAGTGKTHQLSTRYLRIVLAGGEVDRILATTFTRKAAGEILDRILRRLMETSLQPESCRALATELAWDNLTPEVCQQTLQRLTRDLHRVRVSTLDSFFVQVAHSFCLELGIAPQWTIVEQTRDAGLRRRAVQILLANEPHADASEIVHWLNKGDVRRRVAPLLQKTVDEAYELLMEAQLEGGQAWEQIPLGRPLTAIELDDAIVRLRQLDVPSFVKSAHTTSCELAASGNWKSFLSKGAPAKLITGTTTYNRKPLPPEFVAAYQPLLDHAQAQLLLQLRQQNTAAVRVLSRFDQHYQQLKQREEALRFNDIPRIILRRPVTDEHRLAHRLDGRIDHLLLDEFQDTSLLQWNVVKQLARGITQCTDHSRSFFAVGDVKQAIYGWRGGEAEILERLSSQLPNVSSSSLSSSRRSAKNIILTVNQIFEKCTDHTNLQQYDAGIRSWCDNFPRHTTWVPHAGFACVKTADYPPAGEHQLDMVLQRAAEEAERLTNADPSREIAVLVRRNAIVAKLIDLLRQRGVRASQEGGSPLTDSAGVLTILELLRFADHPGHAAARYRVIHSPLAAAVGLSRDDYGQNSFVDGVAAEVRERLITRGYGAVVSEYVQRLLPISSRREQARLQQLVDLAYNYQPLATLRPSDFVNYVRATGVADPAAANVRVMTIHQAKGLQFDAVVVTELDSPFFDMPAFAVELDEQKLSPALICPYVSTTLQPALPARLRRCFEHDGARRVRESMSLLYVALTRAKTELHLIVSPCAADKEAKSWAGLIKAALIGHHEMPESATVYEAGDDRSAPPRNAMHDVSGPSVAPASRRIQFAPGKAASRDVELTSPSSLEGGRKLRLAGLLTLDDGTAVQYGTLMHAWCEQIEWLEDGRPDESLLRRVAAPLLMPRVDVGQAMADYYGFLEQQPVKALMSRMTYAQETAQWQSTADIPQVQQTSSRFEVRREQRVAHADKHAILSGQIDRLVLHYAGERLLSADIIDFKTDILDTQHGRSLITRTNHYAPQLEAYRQAVMGMFRLPRRHVRARLVFLRTGHLVDA